MTEKTIDFGFETIPEDEKVDRVKGVFDSVASKYDLMNDAMSVGIHRVWKDMTIDWINPQPGEVLLDVAGGTGDMARRFIRKAEDKRIRRGGASASAVICDINDQMLLAGIDAKKDGNMNLTRVCGNAECLPFDDNQFDAVTIALGIRNVTDRMAALREFHRVLKPGGRLGVLEFSTPPAKLIRQFYDAYSFAVIPRLGGILTGDSDSYQYLVESIRKFPKQEEFADMVRDAGFAHVGYRDYTTGVVALHTGWKI